MKRRFLSLSGMLIFGAMLVASGCATLNPHEQIDFEAAKDIDTLSARPSAKPTTKAREQLIEDEYFEVGNLTVSFVVEKCPDTERGANCKTIDHEETSTQRLLREAARRGGDLVYLEKQDERTDTTGSRKGRCLEHHTVLRNVLVDQYVTECRYMAGGQVSCSQNRSGSRLEKQYVTECASWATVYYALTKSTSSGVIWRHDPEYAQDDRLRLALERGSRHDVEALISDSGLTNRPLLNGDLPIHVALNAENYDAVAVLIDHGAEIDESVLREALRSPRLLRLLPADDADINTTDASGRTALMLAAEKGTDESVELAQLLLQRGADVNLADQWGNTALMKAAGGGRPSHVDFVRLLLNHGANVNALDYSSSTALMDAARGGTEVHLESVRLLLEHGADRAIRNMKGMNAYDQIPNDVPQELQDELGRLIGGSAALTRTPVQKLDEAPVEHGGRFEVTFQVPAPWIKIDKGGRFALEMVDDTSMGGALRILIMEPDFGYDPKLHADHWSYLADVMRVTGPTIPLRPFNGLTLPPGWEARVTAFPFNPGGALWIARRQGDFVLLYSFAFVQPLVARDSNGNLDFELAAKQNELFLEHKGELEQMVESTRLIVKP